MPSILLGFDELTGKHHYLTEVTHTIVHTLFSFHFNQRGVTASYRNIRHQIMKKLIFVLQPFPSYRTDHYRSHKTESDTWYTLHIIGTIMLIWYFIGRYIFLFYYIQRSFCDIPYATHGVSDIFDYSLLMHYGIYGRFVEIWFSQIALYHTFLVKFVFVFTTGRKFAANLIVLISLCFEQLS